MLCARGFKNIHSFSQRANVVRRRLRNDEHSPDSMRKWFENVEDPYSGNVAESSLHVAGLEGRANVARLC